MASAVEPLILSESQKMRSPTTVAEGKGGSSPEGSPTEVWGLQLRSDTPPDSLAIMSRRQMQRESDVDVRISPAKLDDVHAGLGTAVTVAHAVGMAQVQFARETAAVVQSAKGQAGAAIAAVRVALDAEERASVISRKSVAAQPVPVEECATICPMTLAEAYTPARSTACKAEAFWKMSEARKVRKAEAIEATRRDVQMADAAAELGRAAVARARASSCNTLPRKAASVAVRTKRAELHGCVRGQVVAISRRASTGDGPGHTVTHQQPGDVQHAPQPKIHRHIPFRCRAQTNPSVATTPAVTPVTPGMTLTPPPSPATPATVTSLDRASSLLTPSTSLPQLCRVDGRQADRPSSVGKNGHVSLARWLRDSARIDERVVCKVVASLHAADVFEVRVRLPTISSTLGAGLLLPSLPFPWGWPSLAFSSLLLRLASPCLLLPSLGVGLA